MPTKAGYSAAAVRARTGALLSEGVPIGQAVARAREAGRDAYREKHPSGPFPRHLATPAERRAGKGAKRLKARKRPRHGRGGRFAKQGNPHGYRAEGWHGKTYERVCLKDRGDALAWARRFNETHEGGPHLPISQVTKGEC